MAASALIDTLPAVTYRHPLHLALLGLPRYTRRNQPSAQQLWLVSLASGGQGAILLAESPAMSPPTWALLDKLLAALHGARAVQPLPLVDFDWQAEWLLVFGFELAAELWQQQMDDQAWRTFQPKHPQTGCQIRICDHPLQLAQDPARKKALWPALKTLLEK